MAKHGFHLGHWRHSNPQVKTETGHIRWYHNPRVLVAILIIAFVLMIVLATVLTGRDRGAGVTPFFSPYWPFGTSG